MKRHERYAPRNVSEFAYIDFLLIQIELIDFGACQTYTSEFVNLYKRLLLAAVDGDRETCVELSRQLGYLTKNDSNVCIYY